MVPQILGNHISCQPEVGFRTLCPFARSEKLRSKYCMAISLPSLHDDYYHPNPKYLVMGFQDSLLESFVQVLLWVIPLTVTVPKSGLLEG